MGVCFMTLDFPAWLCPDKMLGSFVEMWAVLINKTAIPTDVTQNPNTAQLLA